MKKTGREPYAYPQVPQHITLALKGLATGTANDGQQKAALKWVIEELCRTYDLSYRPSSDRDTVFAEGKRFVGLMLVREINLDPKLLRSNNG